MTHEIEKVHYFCLGRIITVTEKVVLYQPSYPRARDVGSRLTRGVSRRLPAALVGGLAPDKGPVRLQGLGEDVTYGSGGGRGE